MGIGPSKPDYERAKRIGVRRMTMSTTILNKRNRTLHEAIVPRSIIDQTKAFTAPRGRMEMGGLLFGHVDEQGRNVCVTGFFPKQTQSSPIYCEFDGKWLAIAAAAALEANEAYPDEETPEIRVIGWIHTHPGLTVFLSETDVSTFRRNMRFCPDGRFIAVVVDPITNESGVFNTPDETRKYSDPKGEISLTENLEKRYIRFLEELESKRRKLGKDELPFIISGDLRQKHVSAGNSDDTLDSNMDSIHQMKRRLNLIEDQIGGLSPRAERDLEAKMMKMDAQHLELVERAREHIDDVQIEISNMGLEAEKKLSDISKEIQKKMNELRRLQSKGSEEIRTIGLSLRNHNPRIRELERGSKKQLETSNNILREISETGNLKENVEIHDRAIKQLRTVVNGIPSRFSSNKVSNKRRESDQWHVFWDEINDPESTPDGILDNHIGLIGTNQKFALHLIKAKMGVKTPKVDFAKRVGDFSESFTRSVDIGMMKLAVNIGRASRKIRPLSKRLIIAFNQKAKGALETTAIFAKRVGDFSESFTRSVDIRMMKLAANVIRTSGKIRPLSKRLIIAFNQKAKGALETTTILAKEAREELGRIYLKYRKGGV